MGLQLPAALVSLLGELGYTWPEGDEEKLLEMGLAWRDFATSLPSSTDRAETYAQDVWSANSGAAIDAFQSAWTVGDAPKSNLDDATLAAEMVSVGLMVCAGIVLALKINVIEVRTARGARRGTGYHHRYMGQDPPGARVRPIQRTGSNGTYHADVQMWDGPANGWVDKPGGSTFFPDNMTPQQVNRTIETAFENRADVPGTDGRRWRATVGDILVEGSYNRSRKKWNSAWPILT